MSPNHFYIASIIHKDKFETICCGCFIYENDAKIALLTKLHDDLHYISYQDRFTNIISHDQFYFYCSRLYDNCPDILHTICEIYGNNYYDIKWKFQIDYVTMN